MTTKNATNDKRETKKIKGYALVGHLTNVTKGERKGLCPSLGYERHVKIP